MNWRKIPLYSVEKVVHFSYDGTILKSYNMSYPDVLLLHILSSVPSAAMIRKTLCSPLSWHQCQQTSSGQQVGIDLSLEVPTTICNRYVLLCLILFFKTTESSLELLRHELT